MFGFARKSVAALDRQDLVDIYVELRPKIERTLARRVGSIELATDLAQELFFKIDTIKASLTSRGDAERYFMRAALNAGLNYLKIESRRREILRENMTLLVPDREPAADNLFLARQELQLVEDALCELPEKCRAVFRLSRFQGLTHPQIAAELGISQSLVEKYVVKALLHIRAKLSD
jgi:RNA polymerase sigma factor (sigma-70 family)